MDCSSDKPAPMLELVGHVVTDGIRRYFAARHERVEWFVNRHFSAAGTLHIHRAALGADVARAPANLMLAAPHAALKASAALAGLLGARRVRDRLAARNLLLRTAVSRELEWLICTELLELPARYGTREARRDALAETILEDARLADAAEAALRHAGDPAFRARLAEALANYAGNPPPRRRSQPRC